MRKGYLKILKHADSLSTWQRPSITQKKLPGIPAACALQSGKVIKLIHAFALFASADVDVFHLGVSFEHHFVGFAADA